MPFNFAVMQSDKPRARLTIMPPTSQLYGDGPPPLNALYIGGPVRTMSVAQARAYVQRESNFTRPNEPGTPSVGDPIRPVPFGTPLPNNGRAYLLGGAIYLAAATGMTAEARLPVAAQSLHYVPQRLDPPDTYEWNTTSRNWRSFTMPITLAVDATTLNASTVYDVFFYNRMLYTIAWTNTTTRATPLQFVNGRLAVANPSTGTWMLYLGSFYVDGVKYISENVNNQNVFDYYAWLNWPQRSANVMQDETESWSITDTNNWDIVNQEVSTTPGRAFWSQRFLVGVSWAMEFRASVKSDIHGEIGIALDPTPPMALLDTGFTTTQTATANGQVIHATARAAVFGYHTVAAMQTCTQATSMHGCDFALVRGIERGPDIARQDIRAVAQRFSSFTVIR